MNNAATGASEVGPGSGPPGFNTGKSHHPAIDVRSTA
jgi:hypothetical protein